MKQEEYNRWVSLFRQGAQFYHFTPWDEAEWLGGCFETLFKKNRKGQRRYDTFDPAKSAWGNWSRYMSKICVLCNLKQAQEYGEGHVALLEALKLKNEAAVEGGDHGADPEVVILLRLLQDHLSDEDWTLLTLRGEGKSYLNIGREVGLSQNATKFRVTRAATRAKNLLREWGYTEDE